MYNVYTCTLDVKFAAEGRKKEGGWIGYVLRWDG